MVFFTVHFLTILSCWHNHFLLLLLLALPLQRKVLFSNLEEKALNEKARLSKSIKVQINFYLSTLNRTVMMELELFGNCWVPSVQYKMFSFR